MASPATAPHVSNWWPQAGRQPIEQPSGDVHLILEAAVVIDLEGLIGNRLDALAQPCAGTVVLGPDWQNDGHQFGRLQRRCLALAEGREDVALERRQPGGGTALTVDEASMDKGTPEPRMDEHAVERHAGGVLFAHRPDGPRAPAANAVSMNVTAPWPVRAESALQSRNVFFRTEKPTMRRVLALPSAKVTTLQRVIVPAESEDTTPMRRLILRTVATAMLVVGAPAALFAAPISQPHEQAAIHSTDPNVQRVDYHWNHHRYAHRDWDRHHNRWHYYD